MADDTPVAVAPLAAAAAPTPAAAAPAPSTVSSPAPAAAPDAATPTSAAGAAPSTEAGTTAVEQAKIAEPAADKPAPSLLAEPKSDTLKEPEKLADAPAAAAPEAPAFQAYQLPEGVSLSEKGIGEFNALLGEFAAQNKIEPRAAQDLGQRLVDFYVREAQNAATARSAAQAESLSEARKTFVAEVKADPIFGRNRFETAIADVRRMAQAFGGERFLKLTADTWVGDHPGMIELLHNFARFAARAEQAGLALPGAKHLSREGTPVAAPPARTQAKQGPRSRYQNTGA